MIAVICALERFKARLLNKTVRTALNRKIEA